MSEGRKFRSRMDEPRGEFGPYEVTDIDTSEVWVTPFQVAVEGLNGEFLGIGTLIGRVYEDGLSMPIIEMVDESGPDRAVHIYGSECKWVVPDQEILDMVEEARELGVIINAAQYAYEADVLYASLRN
jgi:hypothetical protein